MQFNISIVLELLLFNMPFAYFNCPEFYISLVPCFVGTFKQSGLYLYFSAWLIKKKILFESKNRTL